MPVSHLFAGIPVANLETALDWYQRLFGRPPDLFPAEYEAIWHLTPRASIYVVRDSARAGQALLTLAVGDLEQFIAELAGRSLPPGAMERTAGSMPTLIVTDAEGNRVTFFEDPAARQPSAAD
jgi:catechol 2,3-dioxygenase-like lactoylglutathione lyase family enzyme